MGTFDEYLERAKGIAEEAGDAAKKAAGEVVSKTRELTAEGSRVRELAGSTKEQAAAIGFGAREKVQGIMQDAKAVKEIKQGIIELEALPDVEDSILFRMEVETMVNELKSLMLVISDGRMDDASVAEEIKEVMGKVQPAAATHAEGEAQSEAAPQAESAEQPVVAPQAESAEQPVGDTISTTPSTEDSLTEEQQAIENAKAIAYSACTRAIGVLNL